MGYLIQVAVIMLFIANSLQELEQDVEMPEVLINEEGETIRKHHSLRNVPMVNTHRKRTDKENPWCLEAASCKKTGIPVCAYDDNFGFGKFHDICHVLQVNCYWNYNFAIIPSCEIS